MALGTGVDNIQYIAQMDDSIINGANLFFPAQFGINPGNGNEANRKQWLLGLVNSAPYLNQWLGRRDAIFVTAMLSSPTCVWQGITNSWPLFFVARFVLGLGLGIGSKSATVPIYSAECALPLIRCALVMMWETWTAFGIMIGYVMDLA
ncbi:MFS general substrate transporter [Ganoderma sinense ZZ0214-1]|uniref:MFS general substrate transporter n=1 Tax=Ganoderma sinense ZZ0214-1 TaxID=1077348 RepID=A0A2G8S475_9APHY|nr:MFS general substrate transporter [Ganoderma sinense ZZ0214-1]